jgi:hypothetical protein
MEPGYIDGIYNYCDRWCERCAFCNRCRVYEKMTHITEEETGINSEAFYQNIKKNFEQATEVLKQMALERGSDLDSIPPEVIEENRKQEESCDLKVKLHPLSLVTLEYIGQALPLMETTEIYKMKGSAIKAEWEMGLISFEEAREQIRTMKECKEIICWYVYFIHAKCRRALSGKMNEAYRGDDEGFPKDHEGSAKIALVAIDKSIEAWTTLSTFLPNAEDQLLSVLALLQKARRLTEQEFPHAWKFIRPGFDEKVYDL